MQVLSKAQTNVHTHIYNLTHAHNHTITQSHNHTITQSHNHTHSPARHKENQLHLAGPVAHNIYGVARRNHCQADANQQHCGEHRAVEADRVRVGQWVAGHRVGSLVCIGGFCLLRLGVPSLVANGIGENAKSRTNKETKQKTRTNKKNWVNVILSCSRKTYLWPSRKCLIGAVQA